MVNADLIKTHALTLGFHLAGIAPAVRFPEADTYRQWLAKGYAGEMNYLSRHLEKRLDCRVLFPPARSVIVCGLSYHSSISAAAPVASPERGWISRYAWGDDYHTVVKHKLLALLEFIRHETHTDLEAKVCVDTVPLLERLHGYYAGLGWIGKNGALINQRYGSWFFLGEILLNLELEYDVPAAERCGNCTRCLNACPIGALVASRTLDARRCLSYLSIEFKGEIPEEFRSAFGKTVFGCDRCQEVCPWNQCAEAPGLPEFLPREGLYQPDLRWLSALSAEDFRQTFNNSPIARATFQGIRRNAAIALCNAQTCGEFPYCKILS